MHPVSLVLSMLLPPFAVALKFRLGITFWINLCLTFLGFIPGIYHALYVLEKGR